MLVGVPSWLLLLLLLLTAIAALPAAALRRRPGSKSQTTVSPPLLCLHLPAAAGRSTLHAIALPLILPELQPLKETQRAALRVQHPAAACPAPSRAAAAHLLGGQAEGTNFGCQGTGSAHLSSGGAHIHLQQGGRGLGESQAARMLHPHAPLAAARSPVSLGTLGPSAPPARFFNSRAACRPCCRATASAPPLPLSLASSLPAPAPR